MSPRQVAVVRLWPWALAVLVLAPTLRPGFVLAYDMVFVPHLALRPDFLGLGTALPRAVPSDAVVAVLDDLLPGMLLQKVALVAALVLAGQGARRLVPRDSVVAQLTAASFFVWNPYVAERLLIGHWPVLLGYAALPWVLDAARGVRRGEHRLAALTLWLALAALSPSGGLIAAVVALAFGLGGRGAARRTAGLLLAVGATNAPWAVAGLAHASQAVGEAAGATMFAAGGAGGLPTPLAVLGLGGVWNLETVPGSLRGPSAWLWLVALVGLAAAGVRHWWRQDALRDRVGYLACAGLGVAVALFAVATPSAAAWFVGAVPGGGLLRDGSRYLGLLALLEVALVGHGAVVLLGLLRDRVARTAVVAGLVLLPLALLPDLAWGGLGRLVPVGYPASYGRVRDVLQGAAAERRGDLLVLPFTSYRAPRWNHGRKVLDPLGRYMTPDYVASDQLAVDGHLLPVEDPRGRAALRALRGPESGRSSGLRALGIRFVLRDAGAPGAGTRRYDAPVPGRLLARAGTLRLLALRGPVTIAEPPARRWLSALGSFVLFAGAVLLAAGKICRDRLRRLATER